MTTILGLTGGIATGKSTVSSFLRQLKIPIIDADVIARQVVALGSVGLKQLSDTFGSEFLNQDHSLNRSKLGRLVFSDPHKLVQLNAIMQPLIAAEIKQQILAYQQQQTPLIVLDAPLLFEQHHEKKVDFVMVVSVPPKLQLKRLMQRDQVSRIDAEQRIKSQWSVTQKQAQADVVIDNSGSVADTEKQVLHWLNKNNLI